VHPGGRPGRGDWRLPRYEAPLRGRRGGRSSGTSESSSGWNDLIGWIEEQDEDDTQGFRIRHR
jgi:hypothetical protein